MLVAGAADCLAQEPGTARVTGVEGYVSTRYMRDTFTTRGAGARSRQLQSDLREEIFALTHSYVYHPNFLTLDVGGGPIVQWGRSVADTRATEALRPLYSLTGRATFLREKPYHGSFFYEHLNPIVSISPGQVLGQENTRYGAALALLAPATPVPLLVDVSRSHSEGRSADRVIDDRIDQLDVRASRALGGLGSTQFQAQAMRQESRSGSPSLPVQRTRSESQSLTLDSRLGFGAARQYELFNLVTFNHQALALDHGALPDRTDLRVLLDARGKPVDALQTFGTYSYSDSDQGDVASRTHSAALGLTYTLLEGLATSLGGHGEQTRTGPLSARSVGGDGSLRWERRLLGGRARASYAARYDVRTQEAATPQAPVIGERVVLAGTTWVPLAHPRVVAGSVVVSSAARTQTYAEGRDYALGVVGLTTRVQRLIGGNIVDGQELLVDYAYDTGRTFGSTQLDQTANLGWNLSRYLDLYYRRFDSTPRVTSGTPSSPLDTVHSDLYGVRVDLPLRLGWTFALGGGYEREIRRETIAPSRREAFDVYVQNDDPVLDGTLRLGMHRARVDYASAQQDVDLVGYDARLLWRHRLGLDASADVTWERDEGGILPLTRLTGTARIQWRFRKVTLSLDGGLTRESQGGIERDRSLIQLLFRRDF